MKAVRKICASLALMCALAHNPLWAIVEGEQGDYVQMKQAMPPVANKKVEITEFFSYYCIHCKHFEPNILKYVSTIPKDVGFRQIHVVWSDNDIPFAKIFAAVQLAGVGPEVNGKIFHYFWNESSSGELIFNQNRKYNDPQEFITWLNQQKDVSERDKKAILSFYNGPRADKLVTEYKELTKKYAVSGTPYIIVGGKYLVQNRDLSTHDLNTITALINMVKQERDPHYNDYLAKTQGSQLAKTALASK